MAGKFQKTKYEYGIDPTQIFPIRVLAATEAAVTVGGTAVTNTPPTAALNRSDYVKVSGGLRKYGIHARGLYLSLQSTATPPTGYIPGSKTFIPALTIAFYNAAIISKVVSYLGTTWDVTSRPEKER